MTQTEYQAKSSADQRVAHKPKIVLLAPQGWSSTMIRREVGVSAPTPGTGGTVVWPGWPFWQAMGETACEGTRATNSVEQAVPGRFDFRSEEILSFRLPGIGD